MIISRLICAVFLLGSAATCLPQAPLKEDFFKLVRENKRSAVSLDLSDPTNYAGIPAVRWFQMGRGTEFCAIQGIVAVDIKLPDGKRITEEFAIVYIDRDAEGIFRVRADSMGWLRTDKALKRLRRELHEWTSDVSVPDKYAERGKAISTWMTSWTYNSEMYEGFRVPRTGYELGFSFFTMGGPQDEGIRYCYELRLREPGPKKPAPKPRKDNFEANGIKYEVPFQSQKTSLKNGSRFSYTNGAVSILEQDGQLRVNGVDVGKVNPGDSVTVDDAGLVFVNGVQRTAK